MLVKPKNSSKASHVVITVESGIAQSSSINASYLLHVCQVQIPNTIVLAQHVKEEK